MANQKGEVTGSTIFFGAASVGLLIACIVMLVKWTVHKDEEECSKFEGKEGELPPCLTQSELDSRRNAFIGCGAGFVAAVVFTYISNKYG